MPKGTMFAARLGGRRPTPEEVEQMWTAYWEKERKAGRPVPLSRMPKQEEEIPPTEDSEKDTKEKKE